MVVVVVLGLYFAGYVATRRLGSGKGIMITALCGSLVSSTAVTVTYAQRLRQKDGPEAPLIAGIALASLDRKSVVSGKSVSVRVDLGGRRLITKNRKQQHQNTTIIIYHNLYYKSQ